MNPATDVGKPVGKAAIGDDSLFCDSVMRDAARLVRIHRERMKARGQRQAHIAVARAHHANDATPEGDNNEAATVLQRAFRNHRRLQFRRASEIKEIVLDGAIPK